METTPWYQSAIVRQQITQLVVALTALFGVNLGGLDVDATLVSIFAGIAALIAVYTTVTRIFKPAPNLSQTAAKKEVEMVADGKIPPSPTGPGSQRGFVRGGALFVLAGVAIVCGLVAGSMTGCAGTRDAYRASESVSDTAYIVAEHYSAVVKEAANIAQNPATPPEVKAALKAADAAARPLIVGNSATGAPGVRQLAERYSAVKSAATEAELQRAVDAAVLELAKLINAVKAARRT